MAVVTRVLYTFTGNISHMLLSTGFKSAQLGGHSCCEINSGVCNNSTVASAQRAFQVSQGSVETLFRLGGKRLPHVAANLFGKRCTKFCQHRPRFIEDIHITKNILSLFLDTVYKSNLKSTV